MLATRFRQFVWVVFNMKRALTREVFEETGITVSEWEGPVYEVEADAFAAMTPQQRIHTVMRFWKAVNDVNRGRYDSYQAKTSRPIPVVRLTPLA